jgi:uncharacterized protein (TIGR01777 family)
MATVVITGGTGMIGKALTTALLNKGHRVITLSRSTNHNRAEKNLSFATWDIQKQTISSDAIEQADYIVHLAGAGVADKRWTRRRKREIVDSRVKSGELIIKTLKETNNNVKAILTSSGIGWYGPDPAIPNPSPFVETDQPAEDFLGMTCRLWQESLEPVRTMGKRLVVFRTGIVLSRKGGALKEFARPPKFGLAAILGNGKQIVSWIHIDDLISMYIAAIENESYNGVYNAVAPEPVSNKNLTLQIARVKKGSFFVPVHVPSFVLKVVLGEMSIEVLKSATVSCKKIKAAGFQFAFPTIDKALKDLL